MYNIFNKIVGLFCLCVFLFGHSFADAQNRNLPADINPYFGPVGKQPVYSREVVQSIKKVMKQNNIFFRYFSPVAD